MKEKHYITRKEQAVLTKKKIFDTTIFLIRKKGYSKITIREICQNAEISVGTFYLYFLSKDDILLDLYSKVNQKLQDSAAIQDVYKRQDFEKGDLGHDLRCDAEWADRSLYGRGVSDLSGE